MRFEEKNSKNRLRLLFRVLNPNIEAQKQKEKIFEKSVTIFILHATWRDFDIKRWRIKTTHTTEEGDHPDDHHP